MEVKNKNEFKYYLLKAESKLGQHLKKHNLAKALELVATKSIKLINMF